MAPRALEVLVAVPEASRDHTLVAAVRAEVRRRVVCVCLDVQGSGSAMLAQRERDDDAATFLVMAATVGQARPSARL